MHLARGGHYPLDRRTFLVAGGLGCLGMNLAPAHASAESPRVPVRPRTAKCHHHDLAQRRGLAHRHLGHEARRPGRVPRSVPASRDQRSRRIALCEHLPLPGQAGPSPGRSSARWATTAAAPATTTPATTTTSPATRPTGRFTSCSTPARRTRPTGRRWRRSSPSSGRRIRTCRQRHHAAAQGRVRPSTRGPDSSPPGWASSTTRCSSMARASGRSTSPVPALSLRGDVAADACSTGRALAERPRRRRRLAERSRRRAATTASTSARRSRCWPRRRRRRLRPAAEPERVRDQLRSGHQRHVDAAGPAAGRGGRAVRHGLLEGRQGTGHAVQERRRLGHARQQLQLPEGPPAAGVRPAASRPCSTTCTSAACWTTTLVLVTSEMGRQAEDRRSALGRRGRRRPRPLDACMSVLLAGGGIRGGQVYGTSDKRGRVSRRQPGRARSTSPGPSFTRWASTPCRRRPRGSAVPLAGRRASPHGAVLT